MSLIGIIKGYIAFGGYLYRHKGMLSGIMFIVLWFIAVLISGVIWFPQSQEDLRWDEFYIDKVIEYPGKNEYRALYGYSAVDNKRVLYRQYPNPGFFYRVMNSKSVDDRKLTIGWAYLSGPWWGILDEQRMLLEVHYKGEKVVSFEERYRRQYPRTKKVTIVAVVPPIMGSVFVFGALCSYLIMRRKGYVK